MGSKAISLLVKKADAAPVMRNFSRLEQQFQELAGFLVADGTFRSAYARSRDPRSRLAVLMAYWVHSPDLAARSEWFSPELLNMFSSSLILKGRPTTHRKPNPIRAAVMQLKTKHANISAQKLCTILDQMGIEAPLRWQRNGDRTWTGAHRDRTLRPRVKTYLSKIKPEPPY
jgi:hypothetical protein